MDYPQPDIDSYVSHTPQFVKDEPYNVLMTDWSSAEQVQIIQTSKA